MHCSLRRLLHSTSQFASAASCYARCQTKAALNQLFLLQQRLLWTLSSASPVLNTQKSRTFLHYKLHRWELDLHVKFRVCCIRGILELLYSNSQPYLTGILLSKQWSQLCVEWFNLFDNFVIIFEVLNLLQKAFYCLKIFTLKLPQILIYWRHSFMKYLQEITSNDASNRIFFFSLQSTKTERAV